MDEQKSKRWFTVEEAAVELGLTAPEIEAAIERWGQHESPALMSVERSGERMLHQVSLGVYRSQAKWLALTPKEREAKLEAAVAAMPEPVMYETSQAFYDERISPALRALGLATIEEFTHSWMWDTHQHMSLTQDICFYWASSQPAGDVQPPALDPSA